MPYADGSEPQVGDRVRVVRSSGGGEPPIDLEGEILHVRLGGSVVAYFSDWRDESGRRRGHGNGGDVPAGHTDDFGCWCMQAAALEPACEPAFYLVEPHEGQFRPIPNGQTFSDGKRAADRAKQLSTERGVRIQVRPIAKDASTSAWRERELARIEDGTYPPMPKGWDLEPVADHFVHLAKEDTKMVAFTESPEKGVLDRQTRVTPGRYLERFYPSLTQARRNRLIALVDKPETVHFTKSADKIEWVYKHGPSSCMSKSNDYYDGVHPVRAYAGGDLSVAYLMTPDGRSVRSRCLVWPRRKTYGRIYGDPARMSQALESLGYRDGYGGGSGDGFTGAKLKAIWDAGRERYVFPYFDGDYTARVDAYGIDGATITMVYGSWGDLSEDEPPGDTIYVYAQSQSGTAHGYRWCPRQERWDDRPGKFEAVEGEERAWSRDALLGTCVKLPNLSGHEVWVKKEDCLRLGGKWRRRSEVSDRYFVSDHSHDAFPLEELHTLEDGRKVSKDEYRAETFTCAGSGRSCFGSVNKWTIKGRDYSVDWMKSKAIRHGIDYYEFAQYLDQGRLPPETPIRIGEQVKLVVSQNRWIPLGAVGTVVSRAGQTFGVSFDGYRLGHDCHGVLSDDSGVWVNGYHIERVEAAVSVDRIADAA